MAIGVVEKLETFETIETISKTIFHYNMLLLLGCSYYYICIFILIVY